LISNQLIAVKLKYLNNILHCTAAACIKSLLSLQPAQKSVHFTKFPEIDLGGNEAALQNHFKIPNTY